MKLLLIPLTPKRAFIYAQKVKIVNATPSRLDKIITKASDTWLQWEKKDGGWQKSLVINGNKLFRRISYEEWALKSIPSLKKRSADDKTPSKKIEVVYPPSVLQESEIPGILQRLGTERAALHKNRLMWAYSHWRALQGGSHLQHLVKENLLQPVPSTEFDKIYTTALEKLTGLSDVSAALAAKGGKEVLLITDSHAKEVAQVLQTPSLTAELERACEQITLILEKEGKAQLEKDAQVTTDVSSAKDAEPEKKTQ